MLLYGKNSVSERLKADPKSIRKIFLQDNFEVSHVEALIKKNNIAAERLTPKALSKIKPVKDLQGIVAETGNFKYAPFKDLLAGPKKEKFTFIFLDRLFDPHNLGVIIRTAACFGGFAIVIPEYEACEVTEAVLHVASGGENYVPVAMVPNLVNAAIAAKKNEYWIAGGVVSDDAKDLDEVELPFPLVFVLGSEGKGIRHGLQKQLDVKVKISMQGARLSFNVAMAGAIFCHEISKQRVKKHREI